jgi:hypothetical protein
MVENNPITMYSLVLGKSSLIFGDHVGDIKSFITIDGPFLCLKNGENSP